MTRDSLQIRLYDGDRERVTRVAAKAGVSVSDYVRKRLGLPRKRARATAKAPAA